MWKRSQPISATLSCGNANVPSALSTIISLDWSREWVPTKVSGGFDGGAARLCSSGEPPFAIGYPLEAVTNLSFRDFFFCLSPFANLPESLVGGEPSAVLCCAAPITLNRLGWRTTITACNALTDFTSMSEPISIAYTLKRICTGKTMLFLGGEYSQFLLEFALN